RADPGREPAPRRDPVDHPPRGAAAHAGRAPQPRPETVARDRHAAGAEPQAAAGRRAGRRHDRCRDRDHRARAARGQQEPFGRRGRARHELRSRARREGHGAARGLDAGRRLARPGERRSARRRSLPRTLREALIVLTVQNVNLFYGAAQALRGVSLSAQIGRVFCLLGRNGVGKTSLLRAISGLQPIASGSIQLDGQDVSRLPAYDRARRGVALVPQGREIFPLLTVKENLETGYAPLKREQKTVPDEVFELFPVLQSMLRRRGGDLSGGQQQQLAIGRALTMRPKLLVLDEPTEGIQPSVIKDIGRAITFLRQRGDMAILLVEQYLDFAHELADDFAVM